MDYIEFYICELHGEVSYEDWADKEDPGRVKNRWEVLTRTVCDDAGDTICIGAMGRDGKYWQYDSYEAWHAESFFKEHQEQHGLVFSMNKVKASISALNAIKE